MKNKIVAVSLFSGAGGLDIASIMAGVPVAISGGHFETFDTPNKIPGFFLVNLGVCQE